MRSHKKLNMFSCQNSGPDNKHSSHYSYKKCHVSISIIVCWLYPCLKKWDQFKRTNLKKVVKTLMPTSVSAAWTLVNRMQFRLQFHAQLVIVTHTCLLTPPTGAALGLRKRSRIVVGSPSWRKSLIRKGIFPHELVASKKSSVLQSRSSLLGIEQNAGVFINTK